MYNFWLEEFKTNHEKREDVKKDYGSGLKINSLFEQSRFMFGLNEF